MIHAPLKAHRLVHDPVVAIDGVDCERREGVPQKLAQAINMSDARAVPYRKEKISPSEIRISKCIGPDEEPTEFECTWRQRADRGSAVRKTWLAIDGRGWHVID